MIKYVYLENICIFRNIKMNKKTIIICNQALQAGKSLNQVEVSFSCGSQGKITN